MQDILTVRGVAEYLRLSRTTVWRWCNTGTLQAFKVGRSWRILRSEVKKITEHNPKAADGREEDVQGSQHVSHHV